MLFLSKVFRGREGKEGRMVVNLYMDKGENLSDWEDTPLLPPSIRNSQDERSTFVQTDEWL